MRYLRIFGCIVFVLDIAALGLILWIPQRNIIFLTGIGIIVLQIIFLGYLQTMMFLPIQRAVKELKDDEAERKMMKELWEMKYPYLGKMQTIIEEYVAAEVQKINAEVLYRKSEFGALQSQINPHFLYNTLESIRGQAMVDDNLEIAKMIETLSSFFRYSISRKGNIVTLRDELNNIKDYMSIQTYRFGDRFSLEVDIDEEDAKVQDYYVPRLMLQPIVENAILHGLDEKLSGGLVIIDVVVSDDLIIMVSDNGKGMSLKELDELNAKIHRKTRNNIQEDSETGKGTGIALPNVNKRIELLYGEKYGINVYSSEECGTDVEIVIPIVDKMEN